MYWYYLLFFAVLFIFSFYFHKYLLKQSVKYSLKKTNISAERWASQSKPIFGGVTFYATFLLAMVLCFILPESKTYLNNVFIVLVLVVTLGFFMGFADDIMNTPPYFKFLVQMIIGLVLIYFDVYIKVFDNQIANYFLTVFWVIGIMNSINMLDNMDAISTSVTIVALVGVLVNIFINISIGSPFFVIVTLGCLAALVSFLFYNWHPAKMYMGDNGSQFIGVILAVLSIMFLWNVPQIRQENSELRSLLIVVFAFIVPIADTTTVTINRLLKGKSPFIGGKDHTTHHLSYLGLKDNIVAIILLIISIIGVAISVFIANFLPDLTLLTLVLLVSFALIVFLSLFLITRFSKPKV